MTIVSIVKLAQDNNKIMPQRRGIVTAFNKKTQSATVKTLTKISLLTSCFPEGEYKIEELEKCGEMVL